MTKGMLGGMIGPIVADEAFTAAAQALEIARQNGLDPEAGKALRILGQSQAAAGDANAAAQSLSESFDLLQAIEPLEAARTQAVWGVVLKAAGQPEQATGHLHQARAVFEQLGARADLRMLEG